MRFAARCIVLSCSVLFLAGRLFAQVQLTSGDIAGTVTDPSGSVIARARVTCTDPERGLSKTSLTDDDGEYRISLVPPGRYNLRVEAGGFATKVLSNVDVRLGATTHVPVSMVVSQVTTELNVEAHAPVLDTDRTQQASFIQSEQINNLPINRRSYLDFALLTPGVFETNHMVDSTDFRVVQTPQSGLSFGGGNGRGNMFTIDGAEMYINSGGVRPSMSQEAVSEFQINRSSYSAEIGGSFGGAINIVSKSGTNDIHGDIFGFLRHRDIEARNYFDPGKAAFTRSQAGATFGAPVVRDKTFVFLAFERLDRHETSFVPILQDRTAFANLTASQQQLFDFFNASGVPLLRGLAAQGRAALLTTNYPRTLALFNTNSGEFPFSENNTQASLRLDHRFTDNHNLFFRANGTTGVSANAELGALVAFNRGRSIDQRDATFVLSDTFVLSSHWVNEARGMFSNYGLDVEPVDKNGPEIDITGYGLFGREIFLPSKIIERHYQFADVVSYSSGRNSIKFGADVNPVRDNVHSETFFSGRFSFGENVPLAQLLINASGDPNLPATLAQVLTSAGQSKLIPNLQAALTSLQAYNLGLPTFYQQGFGNPDWIGLTKRFNLFLQDNLRVTPRFTLYFGTRYELEANPGAVGTDPNNIAPRFGFAWSPDSARKTVIRGGYGIFYGQNNLQIANVADTLSGQFIQQVFVPLSGAPGLLNPLTKRPLTSADIYQTLAAEGVIGNRAILRGDLAQFGIDPSPKLPFAVVFGIDQDHWRNPYSQQASFEIERSIGNFSVSASYNFNRGVHLPRILDRNLYYSGRRPDGQPTFGFYNPLLFQRNIFEATANSFYHSGIFQVNKRFANHFMMLAHYTFSKSIDEVTDFNTDFEPHDQLNARGDRSLSPFDQRHRFVASGVIDSGLQPGSGIVSNILGGWILSPIYTASSGRPFNVLTGVDNLGDRHPNTHRPLGAGRDIGHGPAYYSADARLSRKFPIGSEGRNIEFIAEGFNLANHTNFRSLNNIVGNITVDQLPRPLVGNRGVPTTPLAFTSAFDPRQFQFGLKINY